MGVQDLHRHGRTSAAAEKDLTGLWAVVGMLAALAGLLHLGAAWAHRDHGAMVGLFLLAAAVQIVWGAILFGRPTRTEVLGGVGANAVFVSFYILTRLTGVGMIRGLEGAQPVAYHDLVTMLLTGSAVAGALVLSSPEAPTRLRLDRVAPVSLATAATMALIFAGSAFVQGAGQRHGNDSGEGSAAAATTATPQDKPSPPVRTLDGSGHDGHDGHAEHDGHANHGDDHQGHGEDHAGHGGGHRGHGDDHQRHGDHDDGHANHGDDHQGGHGDDHQGHSGPGGTHGDHQDHGGQGGGHGGHQDPGSGGSGGGGGGGGGHDHPPDNGYPTNPHFPDSWTPDQVAFAQDLIDRTEYHLQAYRDPETIRSLGFSWIGDGRNIGGYQHWVNVGWWNDGHILNPEFPEALVFRNTEEGLVLEAAMYFLTTSHDMSNIPADIAWLSGWHIHDDLCFDAQGTLVGLAQNGVCPQGFLFIPPPMLHVWVVDTPCGRFAGVDQHGLQCDHDHQH